MRIRHLVLALLLVGPMLASLPPTPATQAAQPANDPFQRTWARTDQPVASGAVSRTWMWGPEAFTEGLWEDYAESPDGLRKVQYFDKSRMEITQPGAVDDGLWYVTNGHLSKELITGQMQVGESAFVARAPALVNVAGDPDDIEGPTYAAFLPHVGQGWGERQAPVLRQINRDGTNEWVPTLSVYGVDTVEFVDATGHWIAAPFWEFMTSHGVVHEDGQTTNALLFQNPYYATGYPITDAQWARVKVAGTVKDVLVQCFERRCLTYTPDNPPGWQVEMGNVGRHYHAWRYGQQEVADGPSALANDLARKVKTAITAESRYEALLEVMGHLHVGVYAGDGTMLLGGAERGAADFYLYDFELHMISGAIARGDTWGIIDLAMQLMAMELLPEGETLDPAVLRLVILAGIESARVTPGDFTSLSPLLLRQLGLYQLQPYDLFEGPALDDIRFDALAYFLLLGELGVPAIQHDLPQATVASNLIAESNGVLKPASRSLAGICDPPSTFQGDAFKEAWGWSKIYAEFVQLVPKAIAKVTVVLDAVHGAILAYSVGVTELDQRLETHYGHDGPGQHLTFRIKFEMRDDLPDALVDCGWIAGTTYPAKGPIQGVSVHWFWGNLTQHGTIFCGNACPVVGSSGLAIDATGPDGIARMIFTPKQEENPGEGWIVEEHGMVTGVALYQSRFTNLLGSYAQYLTPKSGSTRWVVEWHEVPGWDVEMKVTYDLSHHTVNGSLVESGTGAATFTMQIDASKLRDTEYGLLGSEAPFQASGDGLYASYLACGGQWTASWNGDTRIEIFDRNQMQVKVLDRIGARPNDTNHTDGCWSYDIGMSMMSQVTHYPSFSLNVHTKQTKHVAPESFFERWRGAVTWEITVTPRGQP